MEITYRVKHNGCRLYLSRRKEKEKKKEKRSGKFPTSIQWSFRWNCSIIKMWTLDGTTFRGLITGKKERLCHLLVAPCPSSFQSTWPLPPIVDREKKGGNSDTFWKCARREKGHHRLLRKGTHLNIEITPHRFSISLHQSSARIDPRNVLRGPLSYPLLRFWYVSQSIIFEMDSLLA